MPLWNFQKYLETQDLRYFTREHKDHKELGNIMTVFFEEYLKLTENSSVVARFSKMHKLMKLQGKYNSVMMLCNAIFAFDSKMDIELFKELISGLEAWNYRIDSKKEVFTQVEKIKNRAQGLKTQIELLDIELNKEDEKEAQSIESQLISVSRGLELGYRINPKEISVKEWIEMQKQLKKEIDQRNKANK